MPQEAAMSTNHHTSRLFAIALIALLLGAGGFGCVGVTEGGALIGIVTDGDVRRHLGDGFDRLTVDAVMTRGPKTVAPDTLAAEALGILSRTKITALFVVEGARPVGLLHVHDCLDTGVL